MNNELNNEESTKLNMDVSAITSQDQSQMNSINKEHFKNDSEIDQKNEEYPKHNQ